MADLLTPYAGLTKPTVGADNNTWGGLLNADLDLIDQFLRRIVPPGVSFTYRGPTAGGPPTGFLFEDGSAVSRATYNALFQVIGVTYGPGDGSSTFNLPDSRARFDLGAGLGTALAQIGGAFAFTGVTDGHILTPAEGPIHSHPITDVVHSHNLHDPGHTHVLGDAGHNHGWNDPGHSHGLNSVVDNLGPNIPGHTFAAGSGQLEIASNQTQASATGLSINPSTSNISINGNYTGQYLDPNWTGINGTQASGGGVAHSHTLTNIPTVPPYLAANRIIKT